MYYMVENIHGKIEILVGDGKDATYNGFKRLGLKLHGQYGRLDYARKYRDEQNAKVKTNV